MPWLMGRRDPFWDVEGESARRSRLQHRIVAVVVVLLSVVLFALIMQRVFVVDAHHLLGGSMRPVVFVVLGADAAACALVFAHQLRHSFRA